MERLCVLYVTGALYLIVSAARPGEIWVLYGKTRNLAAYAST